MSNIDKIKSRFPLVFDGGMGTYYREKAKNPLPECEMANIFDKETVFEIHKEYLEAGAVAIKTNTFGANTNALKCSIDTIGQIIENGYKISQEAIKEKKLVDRFIFADIGPIQNTNSDEKNENIEIFEEYKYIVDKFISLGAKNFLFETFDQSTFLSQICKYIKSQNNDSYIIVSFAINTDGYTRKGFYGESLLKELEKDENIDAVGFNCISGPGYILHSIDNIKLPKKTISIMPNASYPTVVNNRIFYSENSNYFGKTMLEFLSRGVQIIGGCCGTTPKHIKLLTENIKKSDVKVKHIKKEENIRINTQKTTNLFYEKISSGKKVIAVELDPPSDIDIKKYYENLNILKNINVDAITVADCPVGRARIDSSLMGYKIKNEIGIDPVVHLTCRDRNLNAIKALLLGLNIEGIQNIIVVTGDPIPSAEKDEIKPVFNFNSKLLAKYITELNNTIFSNKMIISSGLNINARSFESELRKAQSKIECGVEIFYTQPILSNQAFENLKRAKQSLKAKIMGGILPVVSYRNAVFMNEEISGIKVSQEIIDSYENISKEEATKLAIKLSYETMKKIDNYVDGYYLITPFNRVDLIKDIIEKYRENNNLD